MEVAKSTELGNFKFTYEEVTHIFPRFSKDKNRIRYITDQYAYYKFLEDSHGTDYNRVSDDFKGKYGVNVENINNPDDYDFETDISKKEAERLYDNWMNNWTPEN